MCEIGSKWSKRLCKWIAMTLTVVLLVNQSGIQALAAESTENKEESVCICEIHCNADSVNGACPVCAGDYGKCTAVQPEEVPMPEETKEQQEGNPQETIVPEPETQEITPVEAVSQTPGIPEAEIPVSLADGENYEPATDPFRSEAVGASDANEAGSETGTASEEASAEEGSTAASETVIVEKMAVATQEELAVALALGVPRIKMTTDIFLTTTINVPASADMVLDGQGFSLYRGADENGVFQGTMLYLSGAQSAEEISSSLTLTNICVDGQNAGNRAGSSAIIDYGRLILEEGAVVKGNYNYGTYLSNGSGEQEAVINDYGGGIQVYGELTVSEASLITGNFADEFGGGVYLAEGATLYLHADVIRGNMVAEGSGYGADLYAANGSTIYYNSAIDMTQAGYYICNDVNLIGMDMLVDNTDASGDENVEVYINISKSSGYTSEQIAELESKLKAKGYKILANRTDIDTTDLRDWYVYDHYDPNAWTALGQNWEDEYGGNPKRKYYPYAESQYNKTVTNPVYTIEEWLNQQDDYYMESPYYSETLAQFKEHIYTRSENGYPEMTFVGYGQPAYIDFLFYNPESNGEKVVDFDVDSSQVQTHTLTGTGFLVNTGVKDEKLYGYLVYYSYTENTTAAVSAKIYYLNGISVESLHNGSYDLKSSTSILGSPVAEHPIQSGEWENEMSIQIKATPTTIEVRQQPKGSASDINQISPILTCTISGSEYSGFGPLVAYTSVGHNCMRASSFTYSNLRMYYTDPPGDMLDPLEKADFTQDVSQKYFINLFGNSESKYNYTAGLGQYQDYLKIMQSEGIALITDRTTPFEEYLGESKAPDSNLCEITKEGEAILSIDSLVEQISAYIASKNTTKIQDKLQQGGSGEGLTNVSLNHSVGNIWLKSISSGKQIRAVNGDSIGADGFKIQIMDDITYYYGDNNTVTYYIIKPNGVTATLTSPLLEVGKDSKEWPAGTYIVRQDIGNSSVHGYAYFELNRTADTPNTYHAVAINVNKDGSGWSNSGKTFVLVNRNVEPIAYITDFSHVPNGTYSIYDTTGTANADDYKDTGVTVTVNGADTSATFDYYTVTFYDESTVIGTPQIVQKNKTTNAPAENPTKDMCTFYQWSTSPDGGTGFDFTSPITAKTDIYANWLYPVAVNVHKDGSEWNEGNKTFVLATENDDEITFHSDLSKVQKGSYSVYETTGMTEINDYEDTGVTVPVTGVGAAATINYYTVTIYNDDAVWGTPQIVRSGKTAIEPTENPGKDGYTFYRWSPSKEDSSTNFSFGTPITATTNVYAAWTKNPPFIITASAGAGGSVSPSGEVPVEIHHNQQFVITPDKGYRVASILVDGNEKLNNALPITYSSSTEGMNTISGSITQATDAAGITEINAGTNTGANDNIKYYLFENVTENHTLTATFEKIKTKGRKSGSTPEPEHYDTPAAPVVPVIKTDTPVIIEDIVTETPAPRDSEPKTGDDSHVEIYATIGMIAGLSYLLLYFADGTSGMTEEEKKEIVGALVKWARKGKRFRKYVALAIVFVILVYYHSIGKRTSVEWKELYEK